MSYIVNTVALAEGLHIGSQTPVDDRFVFANLVDLQNYGTADTNCFRYYEGLRAWVLSVGKEYIWREKQIGETGLAVIDVTVP